MNPTAAMLQAGYFAAIDKSPAGIARAMGANDALVDYVELLDTELAQYADTYERLTDIDTEPMRVALPDEDAFDGVLGAIKECTVGLRDGERRTALLRLLQDVEDLRQSLRNAAGFAIEQIKKLGDLQNEY